MKEEYIFRAKNLSPISLHKGNSNDNLQGDQRLVMQKWMRNRESNKYLVGLKVELKYMIKLAYVPGIREITLKCSKVLTSSEKRVKVIADGRW